MIRRQINPEQFQSITDRLTERMQQTIADINRSVINGNSLAETEYRALLRAFDLALFSVTLNSSIVDEKESV